VKSVNTTYSKTVYLVPSEIFIAIFSKPFWNVRCLQIWRQSGLNYAVNNYLVVTVIWTKETPKTEMESVLETRCIILVHMVEEDKRPVVLVSLLTALSRLQSQSVIVFVWHLLQLKSFKCKSERMPCVRSLLSACGLVSETKKIRRRWIHSILRSFRIYSYIGP